MHLLQLGAVSNSLHAPPPPQQSSTLAQWGSALEGELAWTAVPSNPTEPWLLEKGPSKVQPLLSTPLTDLFSVTLCSSASR